ncbi:MAG: hypothetical protein ACFBZ8_12940 [Opitutales bacterium]
MSAPQESSHTRKNVLERLDVLTQKISSGVAIRVVDCQELCRRLNGLRKSLEHGKPPASDICEDLAKLAFRVQYDEAVDDSEVALQLQVLDLELAELSGSGSA